MSSTSEAGGEVHLDGQFERGLAPADVEFIDGGKIGRGQIRDGLACLGQFRGDLVRELAACAEMDFHYWP
ncbi:hypothetical protein ACSBLW_15740 [Thioclava sp. FR2]|uniref:hypothetical protein n=1 Tax=Thioclava sp. FR2 TaxID=3445780 RepID=UPI003EBF0715